MRTSPANHHLAEQNVTTAHFFNLQQSLDRSYQKMREAALARWEATQAGKADPSDACVSVRVSTAANPSPRTAGMLRSSKATPSLASVAWSMVLLS